MTLQEKLTKVVSDLKTIHQSIEAYKKSNPDDYEKYFHINKRNFPDFSDEVRGNSAWLLSSSRWDLDKEEELTELRKAIEILKEDIAMMKDVTAIDGDIRKLCQSVLEQLVEIDASIKIDSKMEYKKP